MTDQQNETVNALFQAIAAFDVDAAQSLCASNVEIRVPERPVYHGGKAAVDMINDLARTYVDWKPQPLRTVAQDSSAAVEWAATVTDFGGTQSKVEGCSVIDFEGDKVLRLRAYWRPEDLHS